MNQVDVAFISHLLNGLVMLLLPLIVGWLLTRRFNLGWRLWWIGAATFVISQIGHLPFNQVLNLLFMQGILPTPGGPWELPVSALMAGLSAGLFEELARYASYRWWIKEARLWKEGLLFGAGHGGAEAILLGALVLVNFFGMVAARQADINQLVPAEQIPLAQEQLAIYWGSPWYDNLLGALERALTLPFHMAAALLVLQVFRRKQLHWLWMAVLWHALLNAAALMVFDLAGPYLAELVIGCFALINVLLIFVLKGAEVEESLAVQAAPSSPPDAPLRSPRTVLDEIPLNTDRLDESRYE